MKFIYLLLTISALLQATDNYSTNSKDHKIFGPNYKKICIDHVFYISQETTSKALTAWIDPKTLKLSNCNLEK